MGHGLVDFASDALGVLEKISEVAQRPQRSQRLAGTRSTRTPRAPDRLSVDPRRTEFSIVEAIDADTGAPIFVVTNRRGDTASCSSAPFAQRVRDSLG